MNLAGDHHSAAGCCGRRGVVVLALALAVLCTTCNLLAAPLAPQDPRCEYLHNPLGLDVSQPRFSWTVTSDIRNERQTAYQIRVASGKDALLAGNPDLWDSGKVTSDHTAQISYAGKPVSSTQRAWWAVRVWDKDDVCSEWTPPAFWEAGLLNPDDWHGQWIARGTDTAAVAMPLFRRIFNIDGKIRRARAYISGLGYFELSINGQRIGDHLLDPAFTRYDRRVLYVSHDITAALHNGSNAIGVMLGNGWFNVQTKAPWEFDKAPWRAAPRLLIEVRIEMEDGRLIIVKSDQNWKTSDGPITFSSIYGGENYDARLEQPGWDTPDFDDSRWQPALIVQAPAGKLVAQAMEPVRLDHLIKPVAVTQPAPGVFVFDAGQNLTGDAEFQVSGPAGTQIKLVYAEKLAPDGRVDQSNIAVHVHRLGADQQFQTDIYTLNGHGIERWHSRFNYNGFRYVEMTGFPGAPTANNLTIRCFHAAVPLVGTFQCSNPTLNQLWINGRWSYLSNLFGMPTDCPHREKNGWTGDAQVACEQGLFYADGITIYRKWIDDIGDEQKPTGAIPGIVPTDGQWGYGFGAGPAWDSAFLLVPWYLHEYYGDDSLLKQHYDGYRRYVDYLTSRADHSILAIGLGDWSPWKTNTPVAVTDTAYYYRDARIVAEVATMLGNTQDAQRYNALADSIRFAFNKAFYRADTGSYSIGSQTALACALFQDLVEPANQQRVTDSLVAAIHHDDDHLDFGMLGSKYVLNALTANGRTDIAYRIASQTTQPGWGWWLTQGATTFWEGWGTGGSRNHTFLGDINAWMIKALAGINPDPSAPGFKHIIIAPHPLGDLTSASGTYDSIRGKIASAWQLDHSSFQLNLTIPPNTTATVYLPTTDISTVRESGKPLSETSDVHLTGHRENAAVIEVGSGTFIFTARFMASSGNAN